MNRSARLREQMRCDQSGHTPTYDYDRSVKDARKSLTQTNLRDALRRHIMTPIVNYSHRKDSVFGSGLRSECFDYCPIRDAMLL